MQLVLQLTRNCNLACTYCYQRHRPGAGMPVEIAEAAVRRLLDDGHRHVALTYFGGEPLLERAMIEACWPRLRAIGSERGALVTAKISTNGVLLDAGFARFARRTGLFVSLSADGGPEAQDAGRPAAGGAPTSTSVERALAALVEERAPFATYSVVTPANARRLDASIAWLFERGARLMVTSLDFGGEWSDAALADLGRVYRRLARQYVRWLGRGFDFYLAPFDSKVASRIRPEVSTHESCRAGVRQIAVDPEGFIYPCIEFLESPENRIGHVERGVDRDAWRELNRRLSGKSPEECGDCAIRERCGSNCACLNLRTGGAMRAVDALLCAHERLVTLATDRLAARLFAKRNRAFLDRHFNPFHQPLHVLEAVLEETRP